MLNPRGNICVSACLSMSDYPSHACFTHVSLVEYSYAFKCSVLR